MRANPKNEKSYLTDFRALKTEIARRELYGRDPKQVFAELATHILTAAAGIALFIAFENIPGKIAATIIMTLGLLGIGTQTHNASHYASTGRKSLDEFLTYLGYSTLLGFSALYWRHKHCIVHHDNPNIVGVDDDCDLMPYFAITEADRNDAGIFGKFYYSALQGLIIPFAISLNAFNIQRQAWAFLSRALLDSERRRTCHWIDLGCHGLHLTIWLIIPMQFFPAITVIEFYILRNVALGYTLFFALGSSHFPYEAASAVKEQRHADFVLRQTSGTVDIRTGRYGRFLMAGLDYQIEHHLLRGVSYTRLPEVSELVKEYCAFHHYPHQTLGVLEAAFKTLAVFYKPKPVQTDLRTRKLARGTSN